jgi:hypothetical protein
MLAGSHKAGRIDPQRIDHCRVTEVDDRQGGRLQLPEPASLTGRGSGIRGVPLPPEGLFVERRVERPWVAAVVVAGGSRRGEGRREGSIAGSRLAKEDAGEEAEWTGFGQTKSPD